MAHQGYQHAHQVYGSAVIPQQQNAAMDEKLNQAFTRAIKSIRGTLENPHEYYESFVVKEILKVGDAYSTLRAAIAKWSRLKNRLEANSKNKELGIYVTVLQQNRMYETLGKLLSPNIGHTKAIQTAACKALAVIAFRPNRYRDAEWYHKKQKSIALHKFTIDGSVYSVLLLLSHILIDHSLQSDALHLRCYALQLLANVANHNSDVIIALNKQFQFISIILKQLNHFEFFELTLKAQMADSKQALLTLLHGLNALLNMMQHNQANRIRFCEMNGWKLICKCLKHRCMEIRQLSLCIIHTVCISSKLCAKYFLNTKLDDTESFKLLLEMIYKICGAATYDKNIDKLLCKLICCLCSLCNDNMIGCHKFCINKAWKMIRKLLESIGTHPFSDALHLQLFALLSCFTVPHSFEKWKELQWNVMFKNAFGRKQLTMKERKLKQKKEEITQQNEYKKTQRICKEIILMLGGYVHSTESSSPEPHAHDGDHEADEKEEAEEDESYNRDIILKYLFESLSKPQFVIGAVCALGKLCKVKHNGNITRLDQIIEISKKETIHKYKASCKGLKDKMSSKSFTKCQFSSGRDLNSLFYFVCGLNDMLDAIENHENVANGKEIRQLLLRCHVMFVLCMVVTSPSDKYFVMKPPQYRAKQEQIKNLKLNACYALAKIIKYDAQMQNVFRDWIHRVYSALKDLAMDPVDNSLLQIALTHVIQSGCFLPINDQNIKQLRSFNIQHLLHQLFKQMQVTTTIRK